MCFKLSIKPPFIIRLIKTNSGKYVYPNEIQLVKKDIAVKSICRGCIFYKNDFTCTYKERDKMPISCMEVNNSNYQLKISND
jgi:hypothetical protein